MSIAANRIFMNAEEFKELALSFPLVIQHQHFDRLAFKVPKRRIFTTLDKGKNLAHIKLSPVDQSVFCAMGKDNIYAVPNKWGIQGWTTFEIETLQKELVLDALNLAYQDTLKNSRVK